MIEPLSFLLDALPLRTPSITRRMAASLPGAGRLTLKFAGSGEVSPRDSRTWARELELVLQLDVDFTALERASNDDTTRRRGRDKL
jgi:hypothetical protein